MSTYVFMECLDHDPPLPSADEVGQHLSDLTDIRRAIRDKELFIANAAADLDVDYGSRFANTAASFLVSHPKCAIGIVDEYGVRHPVEVES